MSFLKAFGPLFSAPILVVWRPMKAQEKRNFKLGVVHEAFWGAAFGLMNPLTVLPLALSDLGAGVANVGLIAGFLWTGANLAQLPSAFLLNPKWSDPRRCALLHIPCVSSTGLMALIFALSPGLAAPWKLPLFALFTISHFAMMGMVVPFWLSMTGRCISPKARGRYFGTSFAVAGLMGALTGLASAYFLPKGLHGGYALIYFAAFVLQAISVSLLALLRPTRGRDKAAGPLLPYFKRQFKNLLGHPVFLLFLGLVALQQVAGTAANFFSLSEKARGADLQVFKTYNAVLPLGGMAGAFILGWITDQKGPRWGWVLAMAAMAGAITTLAWPQGLALTALGFALGGFFNAVYPAVNLHMMFRMGKKNDSAHTTAWFNFIAAPLTLCVPWMAGLWVEKHSFLSLYVLSGAAALGAMLWLSLRPGRLNLRPVS